MGDILNKTAEGAKTATGVTVDVFSTLGAAGLGGAIAAFFMGFPPVSVAAIVIGTAAGVAGAVQWRRARRDNF